MLTQGRCRVYEDQANSDEHMTGGCVMMVRMTMKIMIMMMMMMIVLMM